jgi:hypothetical protein
MNIRAKPLSVACRLYTYKNMVGKTTGWDAAYSGIPTDKKVHELTAMSEHCDQFAHFFQTVYTQTVKRNALVSIGRVITHT